MAPRRLLAATLAAALAWPAAAHACDPVGSFLFHGTERGAVLMVRAEADTVEAGGGDVRTRYAHPGRMFGQMVQVERSGGPAGTVPAGRAVLVPWGYDPGCDPAPWGQSARWLPDGARRMVPAQLRRPEHWVGGTPTFDVLRPDLALPADGRDEPDGIGLLFDYYTVVPSLEAIRRDPWGAVQPLRDWLAAHPRAGDDVRIRISAGSVHSVAATASVRASPSPLAGTWRLEVSRTGGPTHVLYARTAPRPSHASAGPDTSLVFAAAAPGYYLDVSYAREPSHLPRTDTARYQDARLAAASLEVRLPPAALPDGTRRFTGWAEPWDAARLLEQADPELRAWARERLDRHLPTTAEITLRPDGRAEWTQVTEIGPGRTITLRGVRVSGQAWEETREEDG